MAEQMSIEMTGLDKITPYANNPRDNSLSIDKVARSIEEFGFKQPIVCDSDGVIIAGHTRYEAAKKLGLKEVPVLYARDLSPEKARAYRLADNKVGEESRWLENVLAVELEAVDLAGGVSMEELGFEGTDKKRASWRTSEKLCDMMTDIRVRGKYSFLYTTFFQTSKEGRKLTDIKKDKELVDSFAANLADYVEKLLGGNIRNGDWCICTTPRRRHRKGFHFSTEVCRSAARKLGIKFYEGILTARNRDRIVVDFRLEENPAEKNIILYDDIISTGITMKESRRLLLEAGHCVLPIAAIRNE